MQIQKKIYLLTLQFENSNEKSKHFRLNTNTQEFACVWGLWLCKSTMSAKTPMMTGGGSGGDGDGCGWLMAWTALCLRLSAGHVQKVFAFEICGFDFSVFQRIFNFAQDFLVQHIQTDLNLFSPATFQLCYRCSKSLQIYCTFSSNHWQVYSLRLEKDPKRMCLKPVSTFA